MAKANCASCRRPMTGSVKRIWWHPKRGEIIICRHCFRAAFFSNNAELSPEESTNLEWNPPLYYYHQDGGRDAHGQFYGIELETDHYHGSRSEAIKQLKQMRRDEGINGLGPSFWLKSDGSLRHGIEIAFHPRSTRSWYVYLRDEFPKVKDIVEHMGAKAFHSTTCGLHIHRGKEDAPIETMCKLSVIFTHCKSQLYKMAQRQSCGYASYSVFNRRTYEDYIIAFRNHQMYGRNAINFDSGHDTFEFRLFRGTLAPKTIGAQIGLIDSMIEYCKDMEPSVLDSLVAASHRGAALWDSYLDWVYKKYDNPLSEWLFAMFYRKGFYYIGVAATAERT